FSVVPPGFAAWGGLSGASITDATKAAASSASADAVVSPASQAQTTGGSYGYARDGNARFYIQTSSNASHGANQLALALDTRGFMGVSVDYVVEVVNAQTRTAGVVCQFRIGGAGPWTTLPAASGANPISHSGTLPPQSQPVRVELPAQADNQPVVQVRWAVWRGSESGNSSGLALDAIAVSGTPIAHTLSLALDPGEITGCGDSASVTVTTAAPVGADLPVTLAISEPSLVVVEGANPAVIRAGGNHAAFTLRGAVESLLDWAGEVTVAASAPGAPSVTATLQITGNRDAWSPPPLHYAAAAGLTGAALKAALQAIAADGHQPLAYADTLAPLRVLDAAPGDPEKVVTVYSGTPLGRNEVFRPDAGLDPDRTWSREHLWPVSYGLDPENVNPGGTGGDAGPDFTDLFNLRPAIHSVNTARGNLIFDQPAGAAWAPLLAPDCRYDATTWAPAPGEKGDIARAMFYLAVRYDGSDPLTLDLELGSDPSPVAGRFGRLSTLLAWHRDDPVSADERRRNQMVFALYQGNRNPFVDHPALVEKIWGDIGVEPVGLPLFHGGPWSPLPAQGFLGSANGGYSGSLGGDAEPGSARFDQSGARLTVAFTGAPGILSYWLKGNSGSSAPTRGRFTVLESSDGAEFTTVREHLDTPAETARFEHALDPASRFVAFLYEEKSSGNIQLDALAISVRSPWDAWLAEHDLAGPDASPGADPDRDGRPNLTEFALGGSPVWPGDLSQPVAEAEAGVLRLVALVRTDVPGLVVAGETAADLAAPGVWTSAGVVRRLAADQSGVPPGFERVVFEVAVGADAARLLRLRVTLDAP
ncbi:MAG: endonuclease, partial [Akkermansiaceae bacterium]|nr:endonuclease [Akkermansiaceae bacterium]